jgi:hypothetical protein
LTFTSSGSADFPLDPALFPPDNPRLSPLRWFCVLESFMKTKSRARRCPLSRWNVELLEDRMLLSTFTVDRLTDTGQGSGLAGDLRYCITQATSGQDAIDFGVTGTIRLTQVLPDLSSSVTINGLGANLLTVQRDTGGSYRIFKVGTAATVAISGLTISNGLSAIQGGGIDNLGTLTVSNCLLSGNHVSLDQGAGIYNGPAAVLTLNSCTLSSNRVDDPSGNGGGILNAGMLTILQCTVSGNFASGGAGIYNASSGSQTISGSTISSNSGASDGGGIYNFGGALTIQNSTLSDNSAVDNGGGILSTGVLTVSNCTLSGNSNSDAYGSAINASGSGSVSISNSTISGNISHAGNGALYFTTNAILSDCTISGNTTSQAGTIVGAGTIRNCTISGNTVTGTNSAGGIAFGGAISNCTISGNTGWVGGILADGGTISNCTISGNTGIAFQPSPTAGGIADFAVSANDATVTLLNSTIANNTVNSKDHSAGQLYSGQLSMATGKATIQLHDTLVAGDGSEPNFFADVGGVFASQGHNLSSDSGGGFLTGPGDLINSNPLLGPLQDNGGPTPTRALLLGSPAVDSGDNTGAPDFDQRGPGFPRIVGKVIDIGAYEVQPGPAIHLQLGAPAQVTSTTPFDATVTALDAYGHIATGYLGTVTFSTSDLSPGILLPPNYTFMAADNGGHIFPGEVTLDTPGNQTLTVADTLVPSISDSTVVAVRPPGFLVNTTADSGPGSLRQAILDADAATGPGFINFAIGTGTQTINLASPLPALTEPVLLDGTSQPGYAGVPLIELDGAGAGPGADGLVITAGGTVVQGLVINRFALAGIDVQNSGGAIIQGNYIGTDVTGTMVLGNGVGVSLESSNNTIGGTAAGAGNVISGNRDDGIFISGSSTGNVIEGNLIGADATGRVNVGNANNGVYLLNSSGNVVGGTGDGAANTIAFNGNDGVLVDTGSGNGIRHNAIYGHTSGLGIELVNGGNNRLPFPVLTSAASDGLTTIITGLLQSTPNTTLTLEFFANPVSNPSGFGEGEQFLGAGTVTTNDHGTASFSVSMTVAMSLGQFIAATATDTANNTSEFSNCVNVVAGPGAFPPLSPGAPGPDLTPFRDAVRAIAPAVKRQSASILGQAHQPLQQRATDLLFGKWQRTDRRSTNPILTWFPEETILTLGIIRNARDLPWAKEPWTVTTP